jgi:hypothetical protein
MGIGIDPYKVVANEGNFLPIVDADLFEIFDP